MAWESALDRLIVQQVQLAAQGQVRSDVVQEQIRELRELAPGRAETAFHLGYARALLGLDLPPPAGKGDAAARWYAFGRLRGHDRRGERTWVADLLEEPDVVLDLLRDPRIAAQCLPLAMRTLFHCGKLELAVRAIDYLATTQEGEETRMIVDAALADLLTRLEKREDDPDGESTLAILQRCVQLPVFGTLPDEVRSGYWHEIGRRLLAVSEFDEAAAAFETAAAGADDRRALRSRCQLGRALAALRLHDVGDLVPTPERPERAAAEACLAAIDADAQVPDALYLLGMLAYEDGRWPLAIERFDACNRRLRRVAERDRERIAHTEFFLAAAILAGGRTEETSRALRLMDSALGDVRPDLESFYAVHEALKQKDRRLALRFLDAVDVGRGTAGDQLLMVALEYLALGEAAPAEAAATRVLEVAVDLDQRVEAMRVLLTAHNMRGDRQAARAVYHDIRELLVQRGAFAELEKLLQNEEFVGQALDHLEIKCELVALYEEMEDREYEKASLQAAIARSLRARKEPDALQEAYAILREVEITFPDLTREDLKALEKLLALDGGSPVDPGSGPGVVARLTEELGRRPRVLVVGGNERQRRHHPRFAQLAEEWGFDGEWLMANYVSPQKLVGTIGDRLEAGLELLVLLHWNRHETTEPALELARKAGVAARTVHYAGFTSLQISLADQFEKLLGGAVRR